MTHFGRLTPIRESRSAFTLIELLLALSIVVMLVAVLIGSISKARESGRRVQCMSNMKQIGLSMQMYADENKSQLPPFYYSTSLTGGGQPTLTNNLHWSVTNVGPGASLATLTCPSDKKPLKTKMIVAGKTNNVPISFSYNFLLHVEGVAMTDVKPASTVLLLEGKPDVTSAGAWWDTPVCIPDASGNVTICHKPATPAEATMQVSSLALAGHLEHGDYCGPCDSAASPISSTLFTNLTVFVRRHLHGGNVLFLDGHIEQITSFSTNAFGVP